MATHVVVALVTMNIFIVLAIGIVFGARLSVRRVFGARAAYALWGIVPLAGLSALVPFSFMARGDVAAPQDALSQSAAATTQGMVAVLSHIPIAPNMYLEPAPYLSSMHAVCLWVFGSALMVAWLFFSQHQYMRELGRLNGTKLGGTQIYRSSVASAGRRWLAWSSRASWCQQILKNVLAIASAP